MIHYGRKYAKKYTMRIFVMSGSLQKKKRLYKRKEEIEMMNVTRRIHKYILRIFVEAESREKKLPYIPNDLMGKFVNTQGGK